MLKPTQIKVYYFYSSSFSFQSVTTLFSDIVICAFGLNKPVLDQILTTPYNTV